jgi:hypothetical protein
MGGNDKPALGINPLLMNKTGLSVRIDEDVKSEKSEIEEELNCDEDFRFCGEQIQNCLFNGEEISDQLYVDLYVAKLRMTYAYKDKIQLTNEVDEKARRELELTRIVANLLEEQA